MRIWVSGPRILGRRTGVSFGPEDFRKLSAPKATAQSKPRTSSWVYVIKSANGHVKVGVTADPLARLASLQTGSSQKLELAYACCVKSNDGYAIEQAAHATLWKHRLEGEWFDTTSEMAVAAIAAASHRLNDPVVEIPKDQIATVLAISAKEGGATAIPTKRRYWPLWFWMTVPILVIIGIIFATDGGDPFFNFLAWLIMSALFSTVTYGLTRLFLLGS